MAIKFHIKKANDMLEWAFIPKYFKELRFSNNGFNGLKNVSLYVYLDFSEWYFSETIYTRKEESDKETFLLYIFIIHPKCRKTLFTSYNIFKCGKA